MKLNKTVVERANIVTVDYLNGFQYKNVVLQFFPTAEGYVDFTRVGNGGTYNYVYQYKDHLGNVRMNYTYAAGKNGSPGDVKVKDESHYYPFGLKHLNYNMDYLEYQEIEDDIVLYPPLNTSAKLVYNYKYNGQELQDELGLNATAMDWRQYDAAIGRFNSIDVLAELFPDSSPFSFNNPIYFVDPSGLCPECNTNVKSPTDGQNYTDSNGLSWIYNGTDWVGQLNEVVINNPPE